MRKKYFDVNGKASTDLNGKVIENTLGRGIWPKSNAFIDMMKVFILVGIGIGLIQLIVDYSKGV